MHQATTDMIRRLDTRIAETDQALIAAARNEIIRLSELHSTANKLLYHIYNSDSELTPEASARLNFHVNNQGKPLPPEHFHYPIDKLGDQKIPVVTPVVSYDYDSVRFSPKGPATTVEFLKSSKVVAHLGPYNVGRGDSLNIRNLLGRFNGSFSTVDKEPGHG